tara:strand:- start:155 stop:487 length:333 start_codon:yes stop_codon:yes gene_type:complete
MTKKAILFEVCLAVIVLVTAIDIFWSIYLSESLLLNEENPLAKWIIRCGNALEINGVALLCALKVVGTFTVLTVCRAIYLRKPRWAWPVVIGVTSFQIWLFAYLHFGHLL